MQRRRHNLEGPRTVQRRRHNLEGPRTVQRRRHNLEDPRTVQRRRHNLEDPRTVQRRRHNLEGLRTVQRRRHNLEDPRTVQRRRHNLEDPRTVQRRRHNLEGLRTVQRRRHNLEDPRTVQRRRHNLEDPRTVQRRRHNLEDPRTVQRRRHNLEDPRTGQRRRHNLEDPRTVQRRRRNLEGLRTVQRCRHNLEGLRTVQRRRHNLEGLRTVQRRRHNLEDPRTGPNRDRLRKIVRVQHRWRPCPESRAGMFAHRSPARLGPNRAARRRGHGGTLSTQQLADRLAGVRRLSRTRKLAHVVHLPACLADRRGQALGGLALRARALDASRLRSEVSKRLLGHRARKVELNAVLGAHPAPDRLVLVDQLRAVLASVALAREALAVRPPSAVVPRRRHGHASSRCRRGAEDAARSERAFAGGTKSSVHTPLRPHTPCLHRPRPRGSRARRLA